MSGGRDIKMPNGTIDPQRDYAADLSPGAGNRWPTLTMAKADAAAVQKLLYDRLREFTSVDVDIVVFGSLARRDWTSGSDVDWTILIDGQANAEHRICGREVERVLGTLAFNGIPLKKPGAEGIFGSLAFSHEIVHHIGGQADANRSTTQRILLLLEAVAVRTSDDELGGPYERIVRQVLNRYLVSDSNFHSKADQESRIPRFLLNDVVRYWRTMCVDFAYKDWEQGGKKWALRNVKLRTSRKLLFFSGLLMIFSCFQNDSLRRNGAGREDYLLRLQAHLLNFVRSTPLDIISWTLNIVGLGDECFQLIDGYERFLRLLNDPAVRHHLSDLGEHTVYDDQRFLECRDISHQLHATLRKVCFEIDSPLRQFTMEYGVF
jgi:predicted nucleotidyltransferase